MFYFFVGFPAFPLPCDCPIDDCRAPAVGREAGFASIDPAETSADLVATDLVVDEATASMMTIPDCRISLVVVVDCVMEEDANASVTTVDWLDDSASV